MYDPLTAQFFSPDPYVQAPDYWLNYNRYSYCLNNPLLFTDPSGESIVGLGIAMLVGAMMNTMMQGIAGNINNVGELFAAIGVGALAGATGYGIGSAIAADLSVTGFVGGALSSGYGGLAAGFVGGAGNAWILNGATLGQGLEQGILGASSGGAIGALTGGIIGGYTAAKQGGNFLTGEFISEMKLTPEQCKTLAENYNKTFLADFNDEELQLRIQKEYSLQKGDMGIREITTRPGVGYGMDGDVYRNLKKGYNVGGYTEGIAGKYADIHISPRYANGNITEFRAVVGHEIIHAYHMNVIGKGYNPKFSDRVAYRYTYNEFLRAGDIKGAISTMKSAILNDFWKTSPSNYTTIPSIYGF